MRIIKYDDDDRLMVSPENYDDDDDDDSAVMMIKILHLSRFSFHNCSNLGSLSYSFSPNRQSDHNYDDKDVDNNDVDDNDDKDVDDNDDKDDDYNHLIAETHDGEGDGQSETACEQHHSPDTILIRYCNYTDQILSPFWSDIVSILIRCCHYIDPIDPIGSFSSYS